MYMYSIAVSTPCLLGNFECFFVVCRFFQYQLIRNTIRVSNSLDPDQTRHFVGPDLGPNCLQMLSAGDTSRQRVNNLSELLIWMSISCVIVTPLIYPFKPSVLFVGHRQTVQTQIRRRKMRRLIRAFTVYSQNVLLKVE